MSAGCSDESSRKAQGYMEGRYTYIATSVSGVLTDLSVDKGRWVKRGDTLFVLEPQPEIDTYRAAQDSLAQSIAAHDALIPTLTFAKKTYDRYHYLVPKNAIDQARLDSAQSDFESLKSQLAQTKATISEKEALLAEATWTKNQKIMNAPIDGIVFDTYYRIGEYTIANQPILSLLSPHDIKAIFYVGESNLARLQLNNTVNISCDHCEKTYPGRISYISPSAEYTPPVIYSTETREKLIYRIEASFTPEIAKELHPGQPVTVTY
ncbi:MAG: hypothetical protein A3F14_04365 [Gammaproteobacteria bacterium RIFCSPHIGHO2_12_FULL_43_28]|nr:MAG: hypothetical protein A3F14_04365 [Gammaproteobacteria bacterium RIFCSPHIGHO2_12_FULL_43_28]